MEHCEHHQVKTGTAATAATVTLHCLAGCSIGEFIGLAIGVQLGLSVTVTVILATLLAVYHGFCIDVVPPCIPEINDIGAGVQDRLAR